MPSVSTLPPKTFPQFLDLPLELQVMFWHRAIENSLNLHSIKVTQRVSDILGIDTRLRHFGRRQLPTYIVNPKSRFPRSAQRLPSAVVFIPPFWSLLSTCLISRFNSSQYWKGLYNSCRAKVGVLEDFKEELIRGLDGLIEYLRLRMER